MERLYDRKVVSIGRQTPTNVYATDEQDRHIHIRLLV